MNFVAYRKSTVHPNGVCKDYLDLSALSQEVRNLLCARRNRKEPRKPHGTHVQRKQLFRLHVQFDLYTLSHSFTNPWKFMQINYCASKFISSLWESISFLLKYCVQVIWSNFSEKRRCNMKLSNRHSVAPVKLIKERKQDLLCSYVNIWSSGCLS